MSPKKLPLQILIWTLLWTSSTVQAQTPSRTGPVKPLAYTGVNLSGGEFGDRKPGVPAVYGRAYIYPAPEEITYFASKGVNVIRLPFRWVDLQPALSQPLDTAVLERLKEFVRAATSRKIVVILDPHDYARYYDKVIGGPDVTNAAFADFWARAAVQFKDNPRVWFGLMNEPHDLPGEQWLNATNAAIAAIRKVGAKNLVLVPGIAWTGAHSWVSSGNAQTMLGVTDPRNHFIFEVHQYLDKNSAGDSPEAVSASIGSERLQQFTEWCRLHHKRGFLGEFGAADSPVALAATKDMLGLMEKNRDVWAGYTWWSAGPWWGDYMFTLEPKGGKDRPQMVMLQPHLQPAPSPKP